MGKSLLFGIYFLFLGLAANATGPGTSAKSMSDSTTVATSAASILYVRPATLEIHFDFFNASNSITNRFASNIIFGGSISEGLKNDVNAKLKRNNEYEDRVVAGVAFTFGSQWSGKEKSPLLWGVGARHVNQRQLLFSDEAFQFTFFGNAMFEDDTMRHSATVCSKSDLPGPISVCGETL